MKTTETILQSLTGQPQFRTLGRHRCYQRFMALLPPRFREAISFVYVRDFTLHVALRHPGYKMELNYNKELLKDLLATLTDNQPECASLRAKKVVLFTSRYAVSPPVQNARAATIPYYYELAVGTFEDRSTHPDLRRQFERIRRTIQSNRSSHA